MVEVYYKLVNTDGIMIAGVDIVEVKDAANIIHLRTAIWEKNKQGFPPTTLSSQLVIYKNKNAFDNRDTADTFLQPKSLVKDIGDNEVYVAVPTPTPIQQAKAPQQFQDFWSSLLEVEFSSHKGSIGDTPLEYSLLEFSIIPFFVSDTKLTNKLLIRNCYQEMSKLIFEQNDNKDSLVIGNPGIGKSVFLVFLMLEIRRRFPKSTVVINRAKDGEMIYVATPKCVFQVTHMSDVQKVLSDPNNFYLVDTLPPVTCHARIIEVSSPCRDHYKEFMKSGNTLTYTMPIWSYEECLSLFHSNVYEKEVEKEVFDANYELIGGIPRLLFEKSTKNLYKEVSSAINRSRLDELVKSIGQPDSKDDASHYLIHLKPIPGQYLDTFVEFASVAVADGVISKLDDDYVFTQLSFLKHCAHGNAGCAGGMYGQVYEAFAHKKLTSGQTFTGVSLKDRTKSLVITVPKQAAKLFKADTEITQDDFYYKPISKIYAAIDSILPSVGYFQMTVSLSHPISMNKMTKLVKALPDTPKRIFFVVPDCASFRPQYLSIANGVKATNISENLKDLEQYVIEIRVADK